MKFLCALLCGLACFPAAVQAQALPFAGRWLLDENPKAPAAAYTVLTIDGEKMRWSGPDKATPVCVQEFALKQEKPGTVYADGRGTRFLAGVKGSIPTYLLQLRSSTCGRAGEDTRIRYPLVYDTRHIEVIGYVKGKPVSSRRFHRKE
ncbi:hypothetical protein [Massilia aerilata]|uniref:DUF306 domain-containing protein n=1 Tax=Massilia aerilata TaxID=453817 RepID=A0ABW0RWV1_9BURK